MRNAPCDYFFPLIELRSFLVSKVDCVDDVLLKGESGLNAADICVVRRDIEWLRQV